MTDKISGFSGKYRFLSNFWLVPIVIDYVEYPSSEHYYMSQKTDDQSIRDKIIEARTPGVAKRIGKTIRLRPDWEEKYKNQAMMTALLCKFSIPEMQQLLAATGDAYLEETNTWGDVYWGVCDGVGKNMIGRMLMFIREYQKNEPV